MQSATDSTNRVIPLLPEQKTGMRKIDLPPGFATMRHALDDGRDQSRISLWLTKTESLLALPATAGTLLSQFYEFKPARVMQEHLGDELVTMLAAAGALDFGSRGRLKLRQGSFILQYEDGLDHRLSWPHEVLLELTARCNFSCPYCCLGDLPTADSRYDMTPELFGSVVHQLLQRPPFRLIVTGGEPLLWEQRYSRMFPQLDMLRAAGTYLTLFTNGVLVDKFLPQLTSTFHKVVVSLDAVDEASFRTMSGRSGHELVRVLDNVRALSEGTKVHINTVVNASNVHGLIDLIHWTTNTGVRELSLSRQFGLGKASREKATPLTDAEWEAFVTAVCKEQAKNQIDCIVVDRKQRLASAFPFGPCKVGRAYLVVNYDGSVTPCIGYKDHIVGSLATHSIEDVWENGNWSQFRDTNAGCPVPSQQKLIVRASSQTSSIQP